jgi:hypothetical protein
MRRLARGLLSFGCGLLVVVLTGCVMPRGMNDRCEWPSEPPLAARAHGEANRANLTDDIKIAEELAIRFTDAQGKLNPLAGQRLRECESRLFAVIAANRGLTVADVIETRKGLSEWRWDSLVHLPLITTYIIAMIAIVQRIHRRFTADEWGAAVVATLATSLALGVSILVIGHLWHGLIEMIRVGNTHMSYRAFRLGWRQYSLHVFLMVVLSCWAMVLASYLLPRSAKTSAE